MGHLSFYKNVYMIVNVFTDLTKKNTKSMKSRYRDKKQKQKHKEEKTKNTVTSNVTELGIRNLFLLCGFINQFLIG